MKIRSRWLMMTALLVLAALLGACGGGQNTANGGGKEFNQTDVAFVQNMLPHHMGGVKLGELAVKKGVNPQVKSIGQDIVNAQTQEAKTLQAMLKTFGASEQSMPGPIDERDKRDMAKLEKASGQEFDRMWLEVISGHHSAAIQMAQIEVGGGAYPQTKELASSIVETQTKELTQFNKLLN